MTRLTVTNLLTKFKEKEKIVALAAYTAPIAKLADEVCDIILVGDSLAMVVYGMENTLRADISLMINHGRAVVNNSNTSFITIDMPFASYQSSPESAFKNAAKVIKKTGANAVKLEAGIELKDTVKFIVERGILVMGHIGLKPQFQHQYGGYKIQGKDKKSEQQILKDAIAIEEAGAFAIVVEGVPESLAKKIQKKLKVPVIGIGAARECAGQILVIDDLLGISEKVPRFVKKYANLNSHIKTAISAYAKDVKTGSFPTDKNLY